MKTIRIAADLRLFLPVLFGWIVLAAALVWSDSRPLVAPVAGGVILLFILCGFAVIRFQPILGLSGIVTATLLVAWLIQLPNHTESQTWDNPEQVQSPWWLAWADVLRNSFLTATAELPDYGGQLIPGLAIGDTSRVSEQLSNAMKVVSLTHITAVSGANCAIVTASVMSIAALCGAGRKVRLIAASVTLIAFVVLVTPQPSVLRAAVMAMVVMFSLFSGRPGSGIPLLALATLLMLLWNPWWAIDFGFILSVSATAGIVLFSGPLTMSLSRWLPFWLSAMIAIPLSAQLLCQPFIILLSPQLPTYGVLANVIAAPAAPVATVIGLVACLVAWWAPGLALPLLWMSWLPAQWIGHTASLIASFPQAQLPWFEGMSGAFSAAMLSVLVLLALLAPKMIVRNTSAVGSVMAGVIGGISA